MLLCARVLRVDKCTMLAMDIDVRDKHHAQGLDDALHQLRNSSCSTNFHNGIENVDNTSVFTSISLLLLLLLLHWLLVRRRVDFKISTLVYRSLAGTAPVYLADDCTMVTAAGRRPLRSADNRTCLVKRSRNQFGDRCFATAGPTLWNSLPGQLRQPDITFGQFKRSLKTFMFG